MAAKTWNKVTGVILLVLVVAGLLNIGIDGFLSVNEPAEIVFHLITGGLATYAGFSASYGGFATNYAKWGGLLYLLLGVVGFFMPDIGGIFHFDLGCNLAHVVLGAWGAMVGFRSPATATA
jgi:hypothetical protein